MEVILLIAVLVVLFIGAIVYVVKHKALEAKIDSAVTSIQSKVAIEVGAVKTTLALHGGVLGTLEDKAKNVLTGAVAEKAQSDIANAKTELAALWAKIKADVGIDGPSPVQVDGQAPAKQAAGGAAG